MYNWFRNTYFDLPYAITELLISNMVVENLSHETACQIASTLRTRFIQEQINVGGDGI